MKRKEPFNKWVSRNGGEMLAPTNPYEIARFKAHGETCVIYKGRRGTKFSGSKAEIAYCAHLDGKDISLGDKTRSWLKGEPVIRAITERDGNNCFYCRKPFSDALLPTVEHLVARAHKGPDHISNKFLACGPCNTKAGHLSAPEKIRIRESKP